MPIKCGLQFLSIATEETVHTFYLAIKASMSSTGDMKEEKVRRKLSTNSESVRWKGEYGVLEMKVLREFRVGEVEGRWYLK